jgi:predicted HTH domain antitoxin
MTSASVELGAELSGLLGTLGGAIEQTARELIVLELYRQGVISSGKAAELLDMKRVDFIQKASSLGIPFFRFDEDDWNAEVAASKRVR